MHRGSPELQKVSYLHICIVFMKWFISLWNMSCDASLIVYVYLIVTDIRLWFSVRMPITYACCRYFIVCSISKQCWSMAYVSLLSLSFSYIWFVLLGFHTNGIHLSTNRLNLNLHKHCGFFFIKSNKYVYWMIINFCIPF